MMRALAKVLVVTVPILLLGANAVCAQSSQAAKVSPDYRVAIDLERVDSNHWEAVVTLQNPGPMAAITLPFRWGRGQAPFRFDSANYVELRTEYFSLKTSHVDSVKQTVLLGLISDLGAGLPPLDPGTGPIARLFFTRRGSSTKAFGLDTTFIPPHNILQIVTPDVRSIRPVFDCTAPGKK